MQTASKRRRSIILTASIYFCLTLLSYWLGILPHWRFPTNWVEALVQVTVALLETAVFTTLFTLSWNYVAGQLPGKGTPKKKSPS
jgi:polyferredoxin